MAGLKGISNTLFGWISPRATHKRRDDGIKAVQKLQAPSMKSRAQQQHVHGGKQSATGNVPFRRPGRRSGEIPWDLSPPSSPPPVVESIEKALQRAAIIDDEDMEDAGDEGAIDEMSGEDDSGLLESDIDEEISEAESIKSEPDIKLDEDVGAENTEARARSRALDEDADTDDEQEDKIFDANENMNVIDFDEDHEAALAAAEQQLAIDREAKFEEQRHEALDMLREGWNENTVDLYMLLDRRTLETLIPTSWSSDFPLFPYSAFTSRYSQAFLGGTRPENDFIMIKALRDLLGLPRHMRNQIRIRAWHGRRAEAMVIKYCEDYQKLIHRDCGLYIALKKKKLHPLICYAPGDENTGTESLANMALVRLRKRSKKILDLLRVENTTPGDSFEYDGITYLMEPPTLYGIVAKEAVIALVAYEPLSSRDAIRTIAFFHMSKSKHDVWNALALAIVMIQCRNSLMRMKELLAEDLDGLQLSDTDDDDL